MRKKNKLQAEAVQVVDEDDENEVDKIIIGDKEDEGIEAESVGLLFEEDSEEIDEEDKRVMKIKRVHDGEPLPKNIRSGGVPAIDLLNPPWTTEIDEQ